MKKFLIIMNLVLFLSSDAYADKKQKYILNNLQQDFTTCYCYFKIAEEGLSRGSKVDKNSIAALKKSAEMSLQSAFLVGEKLNMKRKAMTARIKISFQEMKEEIGSDFINFSVILEKYAVYCKDVIEKPKERMEYWENKFD